MNSLFCLDLTQKCSHFVSLGFEKWKNGSAVGGEAHGPLLFPGVPQDFSKEVDAKSSLKASVLSTGNQLLRLKKVDTAGLRAALAQVDTQWAELLTRIPVVQEKLHQVPVPCVRRANTGPNTGATTR